MTTPKNMQVDYSTLSKRALETRAKLKEAARQLINANGYSNVRVEDITIAAGVAKGLFYRYFSDLNDITSELCGELFDSILTTSLPKRYDGHIPPYDWLYDYIQMPVDQFVSNPGLLACMFELHGSFPNISEAWTFSAHQWNFHLTEFLERAGGMPKPEAEQMGYVLGAVMEGILYQSIIRKNPDLKNIGSTIQQITETIASIWYRAILLEVPPIRGPKRSLPRGMGNDQR